MCLHCIGQLVYEHIAMQVTEMKKAVERNLFISQVSYGKNGFV
jgi:hypothetical protein